MGASVFGTSFLYGNQTHENLWILFYSNYRRLQLGNPET